MPQSLIVLARQFIHPGAVPEWRSEMNKKRSKSRVRVHDQVVSLIGSNIPCGECEICLEKAFRKVCEAASEGSFTALEGRYNHMVAVGLAFAVKQGIQKAVLELANLHIAKFGQPMKLAIDWAANALGYETSWSEIQFNKAKEEVEAA